jgi:hypothetical protein
MNVRYRVTLATAERVQLVTMVLGGKESVRKLNGRRSCLRLTRAPPTRRSRGMSRLAPRPSIGRSSGSSKKAWNELYVRRRVLVRNANST